MIYANEDDNKPSVVKCGSSRVNFPPPDGGGGWGGVFHGLSRPSKFIRTPLKSLASASDLKSTIKGKRRRGTGSVLLYSAAFLISAFEALFHLLHWTFLWRGFGFQRRLPTVINLLSPVFPRFQQPAASLLPPFCSSDGSFSWSSLFRLFDPLRSE